MAARDVVNFIQRHAPAGWMLMACFCFSIMGVCVKTGAQWFSTAELVFYRCFLGFLLIGTTLWIQKKPLKTPNLKLHFSRSVSGVISMMMYFYGISHLPLPTAVTLCYTSPLFLALFNVIWLKEKVHLSLIGGLLLGFIGIVVLLEPAFTQKDGFAATIGLISGALAAVAFMNIKRLGLAGEPESRVVFYFSLISAAVSAMWMFSGALHALNGIKCLLLLAMAASATLAQIALTKAYQRGKTLAVAGLSYTTVVFASLFGVGLWHDVLSLTAYLAMGIIGVAGMVCQLSPKSPLVSSRDSS